jgi:hypothetical protein
MNRDLLSGVAARSADATARWLAQAALAGDLSALYGLWDRLEETGGSSVQALQVGECYLIQTTQGCFTGRVKSVSFVDVVLSQAAYVGKLATQNCARYQRSTDFSSITPIPEDVILYTSTLLAAFKWTNRLPRRAKGRQMTHHYQDYDIPF